MVVTARDQQPFVFSPERERESDDGVFVGSDGLSYCREESSPSSRTEAAQVKEALRRIDTQLEEPFASCDPRDSECVNRSATFSREVLKRLFDAMTPERLDASQFRALCKALALGLSDVEIERVWNQVERTDGTICFEEFERAIQRRRLLKRIVSAYLVRDAAVVVGQGGDGDGDGKEEEEDGGTFSSKSNSKKKRRPLRISPTESSESSSWSSFRVDPETFDYSKSTTENYAAKPQQGQQGQQNPSRRREEEEKSSRFAAARRLVDYEYHGLYSKSRRDWQDGIIASISSEKDTSQAEPWVVYTCGAMGAGKGYVLHWLSERGYFPLENIVHVDPDKFKGLMPEWPEYVERDPERAGSRCHRESGYLAEIAQEVAMSRRQHVWVDGSLRDADYYKNVFKTLRRRHPCYRFAIFYVYAPTETAWRRVKARATATGRDVPESLFKASITGSAESLRTLTPYVDFLARLRNDADGEEPVLEALEAVDHSGNFDSIRRNFGDSEPASEFTHFPHRRGARRLKVVRRFERRGDDDGALAAAEKKNQQRVFYHQDDTTLETHHDNDNSSAARVSCCLRNTTKATTPRRRDSELELSSCPRPLTFDPATRARACVPPATVFFAYCTSSSQCGDLENLRRHGGLAYLDLQQTLLRVVAFCDCDLGEERTSIIRFDPPVDLPSTARPAFRDRWSLLPRAHPARTAGATAHCWLDPFEPVDGVRYAPCGGELFLIGAQPDDAPASRIVDINTRLISAPSSSSERGTTPAAPTTTSSGGARLVLFPIRGSD